MATSQTRSQLSLQFAGLPPVTYHFPELDSTNACAGKLLTQGKQKHGTCIVADHQTAGRGQIGRTWYSAPGESLCLSLILYPQVSAHNQFLLNAAVALGVKNALSRFGIREDLAVKWPNDIYIGHRKVGGILIQNTLQGNQITACIAGIGINVYNVTFPDDLPNPVSLQLASGDSAPHFSLSEIRAVVVDEVLGQLFLAESADPSSLLSAYHTSLYLQGVFSVFLDEKSGETFTARIQRVDDHGRLVLEDAHGQTRTCQFREISFVLPEQVQEAYQPGTK